MRPLDGPRLKVVRAREHLYALQEHEAWFLESNPYTVSDDFNIETGKHVYRVSIRRDPPTRRFAALIGDCVHNLRSALDHLTWQLSADFGGPSDRDTATQFPIFEKEPLYGSRGLRQIPRMGPRAASVVRLLQPFHHKTPTLHPLWFVHDLDRRDKHQQLTVSAAAFSGYVQRLKHSKNERGTYNLILNLEDINEGSMVGELTILPLEAKVQVEASFEFKIVLTSPSVPDTSWRLYACSFLRFLTRQVLGAIECFEPFYASGSYDDDVVLGDDPIRAFHEAPPYDPREAAGGLSDEEHSAWTKQAKGKLEDNADAMLGDLASKIAAGDTDLPALRSALLRSNLAGFLVGIDMALERVRESRDKDLEPPSDSISTEKG